MWFWTQTAALPFVENSVHGCIIVFCLQLNSLMFWQSLIQAYVDNFTLFMGFALQRSHLGLLSLCVQLVSSLLIDR